MEKLERDFSMSARMLIMGIRKARNGKDTVIYIYLKSEIILITSTRRSIGIQLGI